MSPSKLVFCHEFRTVANICERLVVPVEGIEPPLLAEHDFESCASTSSATRASALLYSRVRASSMIGVVCGGNELVRRECIRPRVSGEGERVIARQEGNCGSVKSTKGHCNIPSTMLRMVPFPVNTGEDDKPANCRNQPGLSLVIASAMEAG